MQVTVRETVLRAASSEEGRDSRCRTSEWGLKDDLSWELESQPLSNLLRNFSPGKDRAIFWRGCAHSSTHVEGNKSKVVWILGLVKSF